MHTETRIGVSVGLRARKCMQSGMHTKRIQNAYKHKKSQKRGFFLLLLLYTACSYIFYCPCLQAIKLFSVRVFGHSSTNHKCFTACYCGQWAFSGFHRPSDGPSAIIPTHSCPTVIARSCGRIRFSSIPSASLPGWTIENLYALYASKNRLCMLCENTTPELTAYNAYRNENRRVRRAEGTKMYAVGDAYRLHTKCIQSI